MTTSRSEPEPFHLVGYVPLCITEGLKGFPECTKCQCYPECRTDCPDHAACFEKLYGYPLKELAQKQPMA